ncbi:MAG: ribosomal protein S18-alanine N-acetyltransferase [Gemmatimonadota bacterium]|nr:ribosomal protein S18-alanine N-acetyltransferase [Gemmatimonadota bacterium]
MRIERASFVDPWSHASFEAALDVQRMRFLVADDTDDVAVPGSADAATRVVGYVVALLLVDEGEIANIAVVPRVRGQGVGGRLLDQVSADAADMGVQSLYLEVRESNVAARALYDSRSFTQVGRRRGYYRHPVEDALVLRRDLGTT